MACFIKSRFRHSQFRAFHVLILLVLLLSGCGKVVITVIKKEKNSADFISGQIIPLQANQTSSTLFPSVTAYAQSCPIHVSLHAINEQGAPVEASLATQDLETGNVTYRFNARELGLGQRERVSYHVRVQHCQEIYERPVTGFKANQDISYASTLLSSVTRVQGLGKNSDTTGSAGGMMSVTPSKGVG